MAEHLDVTEEFLPRHQGQLRQLLRALPDGQLRRHRRGGFPQL